jgi:hypothetical protein
MSEFQYFEFKAIERALTKEEQATLRSFSTRATISSRSFTNEYHWGDFKGDTVEWMKKYFDAHVYLSNFGSRALHLRIPRGLLDREEVRPYEEEGVLVVRQTASHLVLSIYSDEEPGRDYDEHDEEPSEVLDSLLPLRDELARGDLRALYVAWLLAVRNRNVDEDTEEPPVPPGLNEPSEALKSLTSFLWLDPELVEVAARRSPPARPARESKVTPASWLATLSPEQKDGWLKRFLEEDEGSDTLELQRDFRHVVQRDLRASGDAPTPSDLPPRRAGELLKEAEELEEAREQAAKLKAAEERAAKARRDAEERRIHLRTLVGQEENLWGSVIALTATSTPANYDSAVRQLIDLRDLSDLTGDRTGFSLRLAELRDLRAKKPSLIARLDKAGLKSTHW